jgi:hypothetical protein
MVRLEPVVLRAVLQTQMGKDQELVQVLWGQVDLMVEPVRAKHSLSSTETEDCYLSSVVPVVVDYLQQVVVVLEPLVLKPMEPVISQSEPREC